MTAFAAVAAVLALAASACGSSATDDDQVGVAADSQASTTSSTAPPTSFGWGLAESGAAADNAQRTGPSVATPECTAVDAETLDVRPGWEIGDRRRLVHQTTETDWIGIPRSVDTDVELEVIAELDDGWRLRWRTTGIELGELASMLDAEQAAEIHALATFDVEYEVDGTGFFRRVTNVDELVGQAEAVYDVVVGAIPEGELSDEQISLMRGLLADRTFIASSYSKGPVLYHSAYGELLGLGESVEYRGEMPVPVIDTLVGAATVVEALSSSGANGCAELISTTELDAAAALQAFMHRLADPSMSKTEIDELRDDLADLMITDEVNYAYDITTGWMRSVDAVRIVRVAGESQSEAVTITDLGPA